MTIPAILPVCLCFSFVFLVSCQSRKTGSEVVAFGNLELEVGGGVPLKLKSTPKRHPTEMVEMEVQFFSKDRNGGLPLNPGFEKRLTREEALAFIGAQTSDPQVSVTTYPKVITLDEREVVLRSVKDYPVLASASEKSVDSSGTKSSMVSFPIGTTLRLLPSCGKDGTIDIQKHFVLSRVIGEEIIDARRYPVPSSLVHSSQVTCRDGESILLTCVNDGASRKSGDLSMLITARRKKMGQNSQLAIN